MSDSEMQKNVDGVKDLKYQTRDEKLLKFDNLFKKKSLQNIKN